MHAKHRLSAALATLATFGVALALATCQPGGTPAPPTPVPDLEAKLVIASHVGEVTRKTRCAGEPLRYRIY